MFKKAFIGLSDIASFINDWNYGFIQNNIYTLKGSRDYQAGIQNSKLDFVLKKKQDIIPYFRPRRISVKVINWWGKKIENYYFKKAVKECDIFLFIWSSFKDDFSDYKYLKGKGKKIITILVGDEVRWEPAMKQEFKCSNLSAYEYNQYDYSINALNCRLNFLRVVEKYSDIVLSQPNIMQLSLKPYHNLHIPIISKDYLEKKNQNIKPIIVHAPTSIGKGTQYIEPIIERLKKEGFDFEYKRIQNIPRAKALNIYANADIILDQILLPGGGKLAYEGLAMGKVVLTLMAYDKYDQHKPQDCPLIDINENNLYDILKKIIPDVILRNEIAAKGRPYIEKYHDPIKIVKKILDQLDENIFNTPDFTPTFFREQFIPESKEALVEYNKWNQYVADCDWYKENVKPGEREGLVF
jgi:hypothetical protein